MSDQSAQRFANGERLGGPPPVETRRLSLRDVQSQDREFLLRLASDPSLSYRWRFRGATPNPAALESSLWEQTLVNFVAVERSSNLLMGLLSCYAADFRTGTAYIAAVFAPPFQQRGLLGEAGVVFLNYLFSVWPFRKLYAELPEYNYPNVAFGIGRLFREEGRFRDHHFYDGCYWDNVVLAVYRSEWEGVSYRWLRAATGRP